MVCDFTPCAPCQRCYVTRGPSSRHLLFGLKGGTWSKGVVVCCVGLAQFGYGGVF